MYPVPAFLKSKWFWLVVALLLLVWLVYPRVKNAVRTIRTPDRGNYQGQSAPNAADRARIEAIAVDLREEIYTTFGWDNREQVAGRALALNDTEFKYMAEFYKQIADGSTLLEDVQDEWTWTGPNKQALIAKILQVKA
jgi:hypothetical protein